MPHIYYFYTQQIETNKNLLELEELVNNPKVDIDTKLSNLSRITNGLKEVYSNFDLKNEQQFAKNFSLQLFLERFLNIIEAIITNMEEIFNLYNSATLYLENFLEEDMDKLNLYIAAKYIEKIESIKPEEQQRYLFYLTNYFKENVETNVTRVKLKLNDKKVTPITLYERYKKVLVPNPELLAVNFSYNDFKNMSKNEIEEFISAFLTELSANWELLPNDDTSVEKTIRTIARHRHKELSLEEKRQKEEKLVNLYIQKKKFYDSTDPYFRIKGKETFDGYVGYIYSNSTVVLDKFYSNVESNKIAENEAVYIMTMSEFYELSRHSKTYLIINHLCKRVIHKGCWQERVLKYIHRKIDEESPEVSVKKLMKENKVNMIQKDLQ